MHINLRSADTKALVKDRALSLQFHYEQYTEGGKVRDLGGESE